jgi:hypothetical protein
MASIASMIDRAGQAQFQLPHQPQYDHIQTAPIYLLVLIVAVSLLVGAIFVGSDEPGLTAVLLVSGLPMAITAFSFRHLRIRDEGEKLTVRFGPLPLFGTRFAYSDIASVDRDKTTWSDGFGIHWVPQRGWTYNLWGFDCVRLTMRNGRIYRVGTNDTDALYTFLQQRLAVAATLPSNKSC